jgi:hypothetical protein
MRERLRAAALALTLIAFAAVTALASAATPARVTPSPGHRHTRFTVSFHTQLATGSFAGLRRTDQVSVTGPQRHGCVSSRSVAAGTRPAHALVKLHLSPGSGHSWCTGRYHGSVVEYQSIICGPPLRASQIVVCPLLAIAPHTIARFSFRVR